MKFDIACSRIINHTTFTCGGICKNHTRAIVCHCACGCSRICHYACVGCGRIIKCNVCKSRICCVWHCISFYLRSSLSKRSNTWINSKESFACAPKLVFAKPINAFKASSLIPLLIPLFVV